MATNLSSPSLQPLISAKNEEQSIEFSKLRKSSSRFLRLETDKPAVLRQKTTSDSDHVIGEANKLLFTHSLLRINSKVKRFINRLRRIANLNSGSPAYPLFIHDLAFFSANRPSEPAANTRVSLAKKLCWFAGCLKVRCFRAVAGVRIGPLHPFERAKISWDIFLFLNTLLLFFYVPLTLSFEFLDGGARLMFGRLQLAIYLLDIVINMNTAYIDNGVLIRERLKSFRNYMRTFFVWDLLTVISVAGKNDFLVDGEGGADNKLFFIQLLFFTKFKMFQVRFNNIKEIFCLGTRLKGLLLGSLAIYIY